MKSLSAKIVSIMLLTAVTAAPSIAGTTNTERTSGDNAGTIITLWPLFDFRSSPATAYSNLSILGPLFKREHNGKTTKTAIRPFFFNSASDDGDETDILYPVASTSSSDNSTDTQVLKLFQKRASRTGTPDEKRDTMLFPFYISGKSEKYGPYTSIFPFHGNIYERFWRDEYHYTFFPLYGRTVKNGSTSTNWLYPFFNSVSGENESGFSFWPFYGHATKKGVYEKSFILWPFYISEQMGKNTDKPTENFYMLPFYASSRSPQRSATYAPWPFCGTVRDAGGMVTERDYLWPFWMTSTGKEARTERYLPFYASSKVKDSSSSWVMWPIYRHQSIDSPSFTQNKTTLLYLLFNHSDESWPQAGKNRSRSSFWPLYAWKRDEDGMRTLSMPALLEPIVWTDGIERSWAPLWRIFISKWDDKGDGATSLLWNLYWSENRGSESAWELSPLVSYRSTAKGTDLKLLKGLFGYSSTAGRSSLSLLWIPVGGWKK